MKKFKFIALAIALTLFSAFCFTACTKEDAPISNGAQIESHYEEITEVILTANGKDSTSQDYQTLKGQTQTALQDFTSSFGQGFLDNLATEVLSVSNLTSSQISKYVNSLNNYLTVYNQTRQTIVSVFNDVINSENAQALLIELYDGLDKQLEFNGVAENDLKELTAFAMVAPILIISDVAVIFNGLSEIEFYKQSLGKANYDKLLAVLEDLYYVGKSLVKSVDVKVLTAVAVNLIISQNVMPKIREKLPLKVQDGLNNVLSALNELGINDQNKKQAYIEYLSIIFANQYKTQIASTYCISFDDMVEIAEFSIASQMGLTYLENFNELLADLIQKIGYNIQKNAFTQAELNQLITACNTLDRRGLGYFAEKYLPFYRQVQLFNGAILQNVTGDDITTLELGLALKPYIAGNSTLKQMDTLNTVILAKIVYKGYRDISAQDFSSVFDTVFRADGLLSSTVNTLSEMAGYCPRNGVNALMEIVELEESGDYLGLPFTATQTDRVETLTGALTLSWLTVDYAIDGLSEATTAFTEYISPLTDLIWVFGYGDYVQKGKEIISSIDSLEDLIAFLESYTAQ